MLAHSREYTPSVALRANAAVVETFVRRWSFAPPLGILLAVLGFVVTVGPGAAVLGPRASARADDRVYNAHDEALRGTYAGVAASVVVGNVFFWGNLNVLGDLGNPNDGLVSVLGPFYHFDLLLPASAFAAAGAVYIWRFLRRAALESDLAADGVRVALAVVVVASVAVTGAATYRVVEGPVDENAAYTAQYDSAYRPFEQRTGGNWVGGALGDEHAVSDAVVFVPTPYGPWLGHPFQSLSNDAGLDGEVVYAMDRPAPGDFAVLDAYPDRTLYRYTYRGTYDPGGDGDLRAELKRLRVREVPRHRVRTTVGVTGTPSTVRLVAGDPDGSNPSVARYEVTGTPDEELTVGWTVEPGSARVVGDGFRASGDGSVRWEGATDLALSVTFVQEGGSTATYRQELTARTDGDSVALVWPPETRVCRLTPDCGREGTYLPGEDDYLTGVAVNTTVRSG